MTFPDIEYAVREWARDHPDLSTHVGARVFFAVPAGNPTYPFITLARIGGRPHPNGHVDDAQLSFQVWAKEKKPAAATAQALVAALLSLEMHPLPGGATGCGAEIDLFRWLPDPDDGTPRYVVDATITSRAV